MRTALFISTSVLSLFLLASCEKGMEDMTAPQPLPEKELPSEGSSDDVPEGYFVVSFLAGQDDITRTPVTGADGRVRHIRYVIYNSAGEYVKEKVILTPANPIPTWPFTAVKDTLPKGTYTAIFLANIEKTMFPIPGSGGTTTYADVLTNYKGKMTDARIVLPGAEFTDTSEYYWAKIDFSDAAAQPTVTLQRIISMLNLHRNFVDAQTALNKLENNIVTQLNYNGTIQTTVNAVLPAAIKNALNLGPVGNLVYDVVGGLDKAVDLVKNAVINQVVNALYQNLLQQLTNQIGMALTGNANQQGALAGLGVLLNPWATDEANAAIVTIRNFPQTMDLSLNVQSVFTGDHLFKYTFTPGTIYDEKDILIRGFNGVFDVRKINVVKQGLIGGLVIDNIVGSPYLLTGVFIDITDPIQATVATNFRYKANYSFVDLGLKSYTAQTDGNHSLTLSVQLANIANLDGILTGIPVLGPILNGTVKGLLNNITVSVPINLPLLGVDNLTLSGSWSTPTTY